jgi:hypothetical protein
MRKGPGQQRFGNNRAIDRGDPYNITEGVEAMEARCSHSNLVGKRREMKCDHSSSVGSTHWN